MFPGAVFYNSLREGTRPSLLLSSYRSLDSGVVLKGKGAVNLDAHFWVILWSGLALGSLKSECPTIFIYKEKSLL
jgi:hypothetical protein